MGKNNRKRRAMKAKKRSKNRQTRPSDGPSRGNNSGGSEFSASTFGGSQRRSGRAEREEVEALVYDLIVPGVHDGCDCGEDLHWYRPTTVAQVLEASLETFVAMVWASGWLPAELLRQSRRATSAAGERLMATAIAADHGRRDPATFHPRWAAHVEGLDLPPLDGPDPTGWLERHRESGSLLQTEHIDLAVAALRVCTGLGQMTVLIPPPGSQTDESMADVRSNDANPGLDPLLDKVRSLLAKAESTEFDAEAEAFTAKAQELMARHAIDAAMLWGRSARTERPITIRVPIDDPYADAKSLLLQVVAEHSRCQAVFHSHASLSSVVGFESDVLATETMFTSLLVQAQASLQRAAASAPPGSRTRSRSFRSSFLVSYATRIDQRLAAVNEQVINEAEANAEAAGTASALLPVLAERNAKVDDAVNEQFKGIVSNRVNGGNDYAGWAAGAQAADLAKLFDDLPTPAA